jgi:hypothetical protein
MHVISFGHQKAGMPEMSEEMNKEMLKELKL